MMKIVSNYWNHAWMRATMYSIHTSSLTWHAKISLQLFKRSFSLIFILMLRFKQGGGWACIPPGRATGPPTMPRMCSLRIASQRRCVLVAFRWWWQAHRYHPYKTWCPSKRMVSWFGMRRYQVPETNWVYGVEMGDFGVPNWHFLFYTSKGLQFLDA